MKTAELVEVLLRHLAWLDGRDATGRADLRGADLRATDLRDANLRSADLRDANLRSADLRNANLCNADLRGANLRSADLRNADLRAADLRGANLYNADLNEANPSGTNLGDIPVVPRLESRIWEMVRRDKKALRMSAWHTCETTHCRAGWAIHLAGAAGAELERRLGPAAAGALIYHRSCGYVPNFYTSDEEALADIQRRAAEENETP